MLETAGQVNMSIISPLSLYWAESVFLHNKSSKCEFDVDKKETTLQRKKIPERDQGTKKCATFSICVTVHTQHKVCTDNCWYRFLISEQMQCCFNHCMWLQCAIINILICTNSFLYTINQHYTAHIASLTPRHLFFK